jgi:iron uptake system component EfeO
MPTSIADATHTPSASFVTGARHLICALAIALVSLAAGRAEAADALAKGIKEYKSFAIERIEIALNGAKELQTAVKAGDAKVAQSAWIKSRKGWEAAEPITGEFFPKLDEAIDAWPDAKQGYHAIEAALFAGKLDGLAAPVDRLVADLAEFDKQLSAPDFKFEAQGLLNGITKLAYEIGENKSKGGESPYAGTSINDIYENNEGIEAVYNLVFSSALKTRDSKLDKRILDKIEEVEDFLKGKDLKNVDTAGLHKAGEELAVLLQTAAPKLKLKKPAVGG